MSTVGALYLLMAVVAAIGFALGLAYFAWQQSRLDRARAVQAPAEARREPVHA